MNQSEGSIYSLYEAGFKKASMFYQVKFWPVYSKIVSCAIRLAKRDVGNHRTGHDKKTRTDGSLQRKGQVGTRDKSPLRSR